MYGDILVFRWTINWVLPYTRAFCLLALSMGEGTDGGLPGQRGRLQQYLTRLKLPWGSSTGNATGEVEVLARGAAVDSPSTLRSLMERRLSASQHRGKMRHAVLAISQRSHDRRRTSRFRLRNAPFRAVVVVGLPWGEEDQEDLLHHQRRLRRARANFLATVEKALAKIRMFLAKNPTF